MYKKDPAKSYVEIEGVETIENNFWEDYDWVLVSHLDAALRHVGPFIAYEGFGKSYFLSGNSHGSCNYTCNKP